MLLTSRCLSNRASKKEVYLFSPTLLTTGFTQFTKGYRKYGSSAAHVTHIFGPLQFICVSPNYCLDYRADNFRGLRS